MKSNEFKHFWETHYPESRPIWYELKWIYKHRWFRIHSLPNSKRYANTPEEYDIILNRQNKLFDDLIGECEVVLVCGLYSIDIRSDDYNKFTSLHSFDKVITYYLSEEHPEVYEDEMQLDIYIKIKNWSSHLMDDILKLIADDVISLMFVCPTKECILIPYDGGMDIIMASTEARDNVMARYKEWASPREDGL